ncbi:peptidase M19 [Flavobacteriaceae bacterium M23B6Z8]
MRKSFIDLHCHPSLKPFGKSFRRGKTQGKNSAKRRQLNSIWHRKRPNLLRKITNIAAGLTKFTQQDFATLTEANVSVVVVALYPPEKGLVDSKKGVKFTGRLARNFVIGISVKRIRHLQKMKDYFTDLEQEYNFYLDLNNRIIDVDGVKSTYRLIKSYDEITTATPEKDEHIIHVILSIEGAHVFDTGLQLAGQPAADEQKVLANIARVKNWEFPPFFVGLAHHFDNELSGFAKSFEGIVDRLLDQNEDEDQGLTLLGKKVLNALLDNSGGKRIYIDLKHMNIKSRYEYYQYLLETYPDENIPIIVSHGALLGRDNPINNSVTHNKIADTKELKKINFYDDELIRICESKGIFGIQLDERRLKRKEERKFLSKLTLGRKRLLRRNARFIWRQIEHIGLILNQKGHNAWNTQAVGSDFDGIIDPLNGWWTAKELRFLDQYLLPYADAFMNSERSQDLLEKNRIAPEELVARFMYKNADRFLKEFYNEKSDT